MRVRELLKEFNDKSSKNWKDCGKEIVRTLSKEDFDELVRWLHEEKYDSERMNALGLHIGNKGDVGQAEIFFLNLLEVEKDKNEGRNRNNLAAVYLKQGRFFDAYYQLLLAFEFDCKNQKQGQNIHEMPAYQNLVMLFVGHRMQVEIDHPPLKQQKLSANLAEISNKIKDASDTMSKAQAIRDFLKPTIAYVPLIIFGWAATILGLLSTGISIQLSWSLLSLITMTGIYWVIYWCYKQALSKLNFARIKLLQYKQPIADGKITID